MITGWDWRCERESQRFDHRVGLEVIAMEEMDVMDLGKEKGR